MPLSVLIVDCLTAGKGARKFTRDFIGAGPRYIAGFISEAAGGQLDVQLCRSDDILEGGEPAVDLAGSPVLAISAMTMDIEAAQKVLAKWQHLHPDPTRRLALLGGPVTCDAAILRQVKADAAISQEAEPPLRALFADQLGILQQNLPLGGNPLDTAPKQGWKGNLLSQIPGIAFYNPQTAQVQETRVENPVAVAAKVAKHFQSTTGYPQMVQHYSDFQFARVYVECLRGCSNFRRTALPVHSGAKCSDQPCTICRGDPFGTREDCPASVPPGCGFCSTIHQFGAVKSRDIQAIVAEIQTLVGLGIKRLVLGGPDFLDFYRERQGPGELTDPQRPEPNYRALGALIDALLAIPEIQRREAQLFVENIKAALCTDRALQLLAKIPGSIFSIGCETGSSEFADILGRPSDPAVTLDAVKRAQNLGIRVHVYFIHSLPGDTPDYAQETYQLIQQFIQLQVEKITLYRYQELPGSPFYRISRHYRKPSKKLAQIYKKIKRQIITYNRQQKQRLLGRVVTVLLSEANRQFPKDAMGWIIEGGPKISVHDAAPLIGSTQQVQIVQVLSDRLVLGQIISPP